MKCWPKIYLFLVLPISILKHSMFRHKLWANIEKPLPEEKTFFYSSLIFLARSMQTLKAEKFFLSKILFCDQTNFDVCSLQLICFYFLSLSAAVLTLFFALMDFNEDKKLALKSHKNKKVFLLSYKRIATDNEHGCWGKPLKNSKVDSSENGIEGL